MPSETSFLIKKVLRLCPNIVRVREIFSNREAASSYLFPKRIDRPEIAINEKMLRARRDLIDLTGFALDKIRLRGVHADLSPPEASSLYALVLAIRPVMLIEEDKYLEASEALPDASDWNPILEPHRGDIELTAKSVGRIEFKRRDADNNVEEWDMATGFLVAEDVMITNRHVAREFCSKDHESGEWTFDSNCTCKRIDYCQEHETDYSREFQVRELLKIYDEPDLALFKVAKTSYGRKHPEPLVLADTLPEIPADDNDDEKRNVYAVGHPFFDGARESESVLRAIFDNIFEVKRLQPGLLMGVENNGSILFHDCSTTAGNSGSCIVDLKLNKVIGLHFTGDLCSDFNKAVALPLLDSNLKSELKQFGVQFA